MNLFSYIFTAPHNTMNTVETASADQELYSLIFAATFPILCAIAVFLVLNMASAKRKLLSFFISLPVFVIPAVFLIPELPAFAKNILGSDFTDTIPYEVVFSLTAALGIIYLGIVSAFAGGRVMKSTGIILQFAATFVFAGIEFAVAYLSLLCFTGTNSAHNVGTLFGVNNATFIPGIIKNATVFTLVCVIAFVFLVLFFLCFLSIRKKADLKAEDIVLLHRIEEKERRIEKEGVCSVCRYAVLSEDKLSVKCDFKGEKASDDRCHRFEYDPLKREP